MNIKQTLFKLKSNSSDLSENITPENIKELSIEELEKYRLSIDLNNKVDGFIRWYYQNQVKDENNQYLKAQKMKNFIEKMAVWYELRYPDYKVNRLISDSKESIDVNDVMFKENEYINDLFDENADIKKLDWSYFYNTDIFIKSLPLEESIYFIKPKFQNSVKFSTKGIARLYLSEDGIVETSEYLELEQITISNNELIGKSIREVVEIFKNRQIELPEGNEFETVIEDYDNWVYQKEEMLNSVMYRIIERGETIGAKRAFIFAKEFGRNIDIPMMYGVNLSDTGLRQFINQYIKAGGSKNLICYKDYFNEVENRENLDTISVQELIIKQGDNIGSFYTEEENILHQRLVNLLMNQVNQCQLKKEEKKLVKSNLK